MTPERWRRVGELFHEALVAPPGNRTAWVNGVCADDPELVAEVLSLLGSDRAARQGFIENQLKTAVVSFQESDASHPKRVGPYRLVRELGRGGMGTVYLAERDDEQYQTNVAIKLVRRGMDTDLILHRFRRERQTLARLQHPNIARLLDGGTTEDGLPYIVMEYVDGARITDYCAAKALAIPQRLTLFLDVCSAVEYAHRQFVVHRDLKPGNLMVDQAGFVKLLDFGICKLLQTAEGGETQTGGGARLLTPDYASPEQIRGHPVTVTSDVYSLGAVLYELLTGAKPHRIEEHSLRGFEHGICEAEVVRPSLAASNKAQARRLSGDLDNILLRALQKEPARRYESVEKFSEDIRRHLAHQPVKARADTPAYRVTKFVRRRSGLVAAMAAVILSLGAGVVVSVHEARKANESLREIRRLSNTFVFDVHDAVGELPGSTRARQMIVQTGLQYLDRLARNARGDAELQSELAAAYHRIGDVQGNVLASNLGNTAGALDSYQKALSLLDPVVRRDPSNRAARAEQATLHERIGGIHAYTRDAKQALSSYRAAEWLAEAMLSGNPSDAKIMKQLAGIQIAAADVMRNTGDYTAALATNSKALALLTELAAKSPEDPSIRTSLASAHSAVGMSDVRLGRLREGLARYREAATLMERVASQDPANVTTQRGLMFAYAHIGDVLGNPNLNNLEDSAAAAQAYRQMLKVARQIHEADPADQRAAGDYGVALARVAATMTGDKTGERIALLRQSVNLHREVARVNPGNLTNQSDMAFAHSLMGDAFADAGKSGDAIDAYRESLNLSESAMKAGSGSSLLMIVSLCRKLGEDAAVRGNREAALAYARRALELCDSTNGRPADLQRFLTPRGAAAMGLVHRKLGDTAEARRWLEQSLSSWRQVQNHPAFASPHRKELKSVETALANLERR